MKYIGALLASATVPGLCEHACTHECLVVVYNSIIVIVV